MNPTTLMRITTRCGQAPVNGLNQALSAKAVDVKVMKTNRVRADTTVVEPNVAYPSDSSLLAKGVAEMAESAKRLKAMGLRGEAHPADRQDAHGALRARSIGANLRRRTDDKLAEVRRIIDGELAGIADRVARQADAGATPAASSRALGDQASGLARAAWTSWSGPPR